MVERMRKKLMSVLITGLAMGLACGECAAQSAVTGDDAQSTRFSGLVGRFAAQAARTANPAPAKSTVDFAPGGGRDFSFGTAASPAKAADVFAPGSRAGSIANAISGGEPQGLDQREALLHASETLDFSAGREFIASGAATGFGVDLGFQPRVQFATSLFGEFRGAGAEVRIGRLHIDPRAAEGEHKSRFYAFGSVDGSAVIWNVADSGRFGASSALNYDVQRITVGDAQAGLAYERWGLQFSAGYLRRELHFNAAGGENAADTFHYGALSISFKR